MQRWMMRVLVTFIAITATLLSLSGCGPGLKEQAAKDQQEAQRAEAQPAQEPAPEPEAEEIKPAPTPAPEATDADPIEFEDINFDFDRYDLKGQSRHILTQIACLMFDRTELSLIIEGHCDERGSNEYNLALGERRAKTAKDYLIEMGVEPHRISTLSYGEEMPLVIGHNEAAWAKNRRAHFEIFH